jgi:hypothetical protein
MKLSKITLALNASKAAILRYRRLKEAARFNPPQPATGGFPYFTQK